MDMFRISWLAILRKMNEKYFEGYVFNLGNQHLGKGVKTMNIKKPPPLLEKASVYDYEQT